MHVDHKRTIILSSIQVLISVLVSLSYLLVECDEPLDLWLTMFCLIITIRNACKTVTTCANIWPYLMFYVLIIWSFIGQSMVSQCKACHDPTSNIYGFCQWCLFMLYSICIYNFFPAFASIVITLWLIAAIPVIAVLECFQIVSGGLSSKILAFMERMDEEHSKANATRCHQLAQLPIITCDGNVGASEECGICLATYSTADNLRLLPCMHRFHSDCIDGWIVKTNLCPMCRVKVFHT
eukprot:78403_1